MLKQGLLIFCLLINLFLVYSFSYSADPVSELTDLKTEMFQRFINDDLFDYQIFDESFYTSFQSGSATDCTNFNGRYQFVIHSGFSKAYCSRISDSVIAQKIHVHLFSHRFISPHQNIFHFYAIHFSLDGLSPAVFREDSAAYLVSPFVSDRMVAGVQFEVSDYQSNSVHLSEQRGYRIKIYRDYEIISGSWLCGLNFKYSIDGLPVLFFLNTACSDRAVMGMDAYDEAYRDLYYHEMPAFYASVQSFSRFLIQFVLMIEGQEIEIGRNSPVFPVFHDKVFWTGGYRSVWMKNGYYHSLYSRLNFAEILLWKEKIPFGWRMEYSLGLKNIQTDRFYSGFQISFF